MSSTPGCGSEPFGQGFSLPIWQQIHRDPFFEINQECAKRNPAPKRESIHSQHAWRWVRSVLGSMDQPKQRVGTGGEAHPYHQPLSRFPTESKADERQDIRESPRVPGV